jgi:hypothetical protein
MPTPTIAKKLSKTEQKRNLICMSCQSAVPIDEAHSNIGEIMRISGYTPVMHITTSITWLCPACTAIAAPHIKALVDLLKNDEVYWGCLPSILKDREKSDVG